MAGELGAISIRQILVTATISVVGGSVYYRYIYDPTDKDMKAVSIEAIDRVLKSKQATFDGFTKIIDSGGSLQLRQVGLRTAGRVGVTLENAKDPEVQKIFNIWENPRNRAGHSSAQDEFATRFLAASGRTEGDFIAGMAFDERMSEEGRLALVEALERRSIDFYRWLEQQRDRKVKEMMRK